MSFVKMLTHVKYNTTWYMIQYIYSYNYGDYLSLTLNGVAYNAVCVLDSVIAVLSLLVCFSHVVFLELNKAAVKPKEITSWCSTVISLRIKDYFGGRTPAYTSHTSPDVCGFWFTGGQDDHSPQGLRAPIYSPLYDHIKKAKCSGVPD